MESHGKAQPLLFLVTINKAVNPPKLSKSCFFVSDLFSWHFPVASPNLKI